MSKREKTENRSLVNITGLRRGSRAPAVTVQPPPPADPSLLDPYDWGPNGIPEGKPIRYIPGQGFVIED